MKNIRKFIKSQKLRIVDVIQIIGVLSAIVISILSFIQSRQEYKHQVDIDTPDLTISAELLKAESVGLHEFEDYSYPIPGTNGLLSIKVKINIDNISQRKMSITQIHGLPVLYDDSKDGIGWTPFFHYDESGEITSFIGGFERKINGEIVIQNPPFLLEEGGSIELIGTIRWPLTRQSRDIIASVLAETTQTCSLADIEKILAEHGTSIGRAEVTYDKLNNTPLPYPIYLETPKLIYRIEIKTNLATTHTYYLYPISDNSIPGIAKIFLNYPQDISDLENLPTPIRINP